MDPTTQARNWRQREQARRAARGARAQAARLEAMQDLDAAVPGGTGDLTPAQALGALPVATGADIGRLFLVRNDGATDTLNVAITQADGTVTIVPLNLDLPSNALTFAPRGTLGAAGTGAGQFNLPLGVALDSSGNLFVADTGNNRVQKYTVSTATWTTLGGTASGSGTGQFNNPWDLWVDPSGTSQNVVVADSYNNRIEILTNANAYSAQFGTSGTGNNQYAYTGGVAVDAAGLRYVTDYNNHRVQIITAANAYSSQFGSNGTGNGQFANPRGIAVGADGNIWVADLNNNRVQKFTSGGTYTLKFGSFGNGLGQFNGPTDVALDSAGNVYVADRGNHRIQVFDSSGNFLTTFGSYGSGSGQLSYPSGVVVDFAGNVYIADTFNNRIAVWGQPDTSTFSSYTEFDDFNGGNTSSGSIGELGWGASGNGSVATQASTTYHAGIVRLASGGTSGNKHQINFGPFLLGQVARAQFLFSPVQNTSVLYRVGLLDSPTTPTAGIYAEFDTSPADTTWRAVKNVGGTATRTDTGVALAAGSWYRATVASTGPGAVTVTVRRMDTGQEVVVAHSGISSSAQLLLAFYVQTRTGSGRQLDVDAALLETQNVWRV